MPQIFQVLKCYKCSVFQVHQTKKSNKWHCKLCGEKQSLKRHYGLGTGKECRLHVQKLNGIRGEIDEINESIELTNNSDEEDITQENGTLSNSNVSDNAPTDRESKWSNFVEKTQPVNEPESNESMYLGNTEVVLEAPTKKRKKFNAPKIKHKPSAPTSFRNELLKENKLEFGENTLTSSHQSFPKINAFAKVDSHLPKSTATYSMSTLPEIQTHISLSNVENINNSNLGDTVNKPTNLYENPAKVFIPPKANKNSKWALFADELDEENQDLSIGEEDVSAKVLSREISRECLNVPSKLFALCDEDDLDDVFTI